MKKLRKIITVSKVSLVSFFSGARALSLAAVTWIAMYYVTGGIRFYATASEYAMAPWLFPFLLNARNNRIIFFSIALLLFCDVGKKDAVHPYQVIRTGTMVYTLGRLFYIMVVAALYVLFLVVASILINIGQIGYSPEWGKVLGTFVKERFLENGLIGSANIIRYLSAGEAMTVSCVLAWGGLCMIGLTIYLVELYTRRAQLGVLTAGAIVIIDYIGYTVGSVDYNRFRWIYPLSWCDLSRLRYGSYLHGPTLTYALTATVIVLTGLILLSIAGAWLQHKGGNRWKRTKR